MLKINLLYYNCIKFVNRCLSLMTAPGLTPRVRKAGLVFGFLFVFLRVGGVCAAYRMSRFDLGKRHNHRVSLNHYDLFFFLLGGGSWFFAEHN